MSENVWKDFPVAPEGFSGWSCPSCKFTFSLALAAAVGRSEYDCPNCGDSVEATSLVVSVTSDSTVFFDKQAVKNARWFHATQKRNWMAELLEDDMELPLVHVGTELSAIFRSRDLRDCGSHDVEEWYVYELAIKSSAEIFDNIDWDENEDAPESVIHLLEDEKYGANKIVRYINSYEDPGSISLILDPRMVKVVGVRTFQPEELDEFFDMVHDEAA